MGLSTLWLLAVLQVQSEPTRVVVRPDAFELAVDSAQQLRAEVFDAQGEVLSVPTLRVLYSVYGTRCLKRFSTRFRCRFSIGAVLY